ncbi:YjcZ family sporulation protein [Paenibacillus pasadenensis]|nr:YjcZ family sporulation protein [Paenibacillus pasadenensis]MCM3748061.1 YjcZ family sporulation protein [Paenibacillus pasadenensis]
MGIGAAGWGSTGVILVLFILLVIIASVFCWAA